MNPQEQLENEQEDHSPKNPWSTCSPKSEAESGPQRTTPSSSRHHGNQM